MSIGILGSPFSTLISHFTTEILVLALNEKSWTRNTQFITEILKVTQFILNTKAFCNMIFCKFHRNTLIFLLRSLIRMFQNISIEIFYFWRSWRMFFLLLFPFGVTKSNLFLSQILVQFTFLVINYFMTLKWMSFIIFVFSTQKNKNPCISWLNYLCSHFQYLNTWIPRFSFGQ